MTPTEDVRKGLDERGIEYRTLVPSGSLAWEYGSKHFCAVEIFGKLYLETSQGPLTPAQAIAATVGATEPLPNPCRTSAELSKRLREVHGLHAFAELFGFDWSDGSDWTWHDVACAMADAVDAATVGAEPDDMTMLKLHDEMNATLLEYERAVGVEEASGAITVPFVARMHELLEEAATVDAGTTRVDETETHERTRSKATKVTSTSDGVVGRCTCSKCGETVHRRDLYCWHCGREFE